MGEEKSSSTTKSVKKSLRLLKRIMTSNGEIGLSELGEATGYNVTTTYRLLKTLMEEGFVSQNKITKKYDIGPEFFFFRISSGRHEKYFSRVAHLLAECTEETEETTNLFIRDGNEALCILGKESKYALRAFLEIGRRIPLHQTAAGKALLAFSDIREVSGGELDTPEAKGLMEELALSRERGYTLEINEYDEEITAVGVPVIDHRGRAICSLSTIAPSSRTSQKKIETIAKKLTETALAISEAMENILFV